MKRSTRWMIFTVYYISQILGLLGFSYNAVSGELETNIFITFYSALISVLMFCVAPLFLRIKWRNRNGNGPELHLQISTITTLIHIAAVLITVLLSWIKRKQLFGIIRDFQLLRRHFFNKFKSSKRVEQYYEKSIRSKFCMGLMSNTIWFFLSHDIIPEIFEVESIIITALLGILCITLNIIIDHYFFALLNINVLLAVVNEELERVLETSSVLVKLARLKQIKPGALIEACWKLSDKLDNLAMEHYKLQKIGERVNRLYELHGACVVLTLYLNNIGVIYMTYMIIQHEKLSQEYDTMVIIIILTIALFFFYKDLGIFTSNMLHFGDFIKKTSSLLNDRQTWLPTLDDRLEKSLKDFSIQLALFPFQMKLFGLFQYDRSMSFATFSSTITNAIVLMQYDYKYSKN